MLSLFSKTLGKNAILLAVFRIFPLLKLWFCTETFEGAGNVGKELLPLVPEELEKAELKSANSSVAALHKNQEKVH